MGIDSHLEHKNAEDFKTQLLSHLENTSTNIVDLSEVERAGLASVQLLLSLQKTAAEEQRDIQFKVSESLQSILTDLGLEDHFSNQEGV